RGGRRDHRVADRHCPRGRSLLRAVPVEPPLWTRLPVDALGPAQADVARQARQERRRPSMSEPELTTVADDEVVFHAGADVRHYVDLDPDTEYDLEGQLV